MSTKQHTLLALLCFSALDLNLIHILFAEWVFEEVASADGHIFKCILFSSRVFYGAHSCLICLIKTEKPCNRKPFIVIIFSW
jgi:hypothetical protein